MNDQTKLNNKIISYYIACNRSAYQATNTRIIFEY